MTTSQLNSVAPQPSKTLDAMELRSLPAGRALCGPLTEASQSPADYSATPHQSMMHNAITLMAVM